MTALSDVLLVVLAVLVEGKTELLDGRDDDLVPRSRRTQGGGQAPQCWCVSSTQLSWKRLNSSTGLAIEVLTIDDEQTLVDAVVLVLSSVDALKEVSVLPESGRVPDVAVAAVLVDAVNNGFYSVDLVRAHHQELLFARDEDHVLADHLAEGCTWRGTARRSRRGGQSWCCPRPQTGRSEGTAPWRRRRSAARCCWQSTMCPSGC